MLRLGGERPELRVVDDQRCTPTYVPHLARAILFLLEQAGATVPVTVHGAAGGQSHFRGGRANSQGRARHAAKIGTVPWGTYHVTNGGETTWREFAVEIFRLARMNVAVRPIGTAE